MPVSPSRACGTKGWRACTPHFGNWQSQRTIGALLSLVAATMIGSCSDQGRPMNRKLLVLGLTLFALPPSHATAVDCPGNPAALGTERVLAIDPAQTAPVGRKQFPQTLPLAPKEIVLTFDDGPLAGTTDRVLDALKRECVRATFFMLGRNAAAHPALAKRVSAE